MVDVPPLVAVLAAGAATRFGGGKLDAPLVGKPVGQWVIDAVHDAGLPPGLIVVPGHPPQFALASGWPLLTNICASDGLGTSIALAASAALGQGRHLLVLLADMPLVTPDHLRALLAAGEAATAWPGNRAGVPALVGPRLLPALAELAGQEGAGPLLARQQDLPRLTVADAMLRDIDRPEDLLEAANRLHARSR
jgi:molybdenum cofactor cytidylyltransferase